jgi:hypothetical protein
MPTPCGSTAAQLASPQFASGNLNEWLADPMSQPVMTEMFMALHGRSTNSLKGSQRGRVAAQCQTAFDRSVPAVAIWCRH